MNAATCGNVVCFETLVPHVRCAHPEYAAELDWRIMFKICSMDTGSDIQAECEVIIGDHKEVFPLITTLWTRAEYELQWRSALQDLISGVVNSCALVTDIQPPDESAGIAYWALFREGTAVYFQERLSRDPSPHLTGSARLAEPHIAPRIQGTAEERSCVSEWVLSIKDIKP
jgi:CdiI N-terminal domain